MKKRVRIRKLGSSLKHSKAIMRSLLTSLVEHERIVTTVAKAKELKIEADKLITKAKNKDKLHGRRMVNKILYTKETQTKVMHVLGPRYQFREGGYTRVMKLAKHRGRDAADMAAIEYVDRPGEIRAARPPSIFQKKSLEEVMKDLSLDPAPYIEEVDEGEDDPLYVAPEKSEEATEEAKEDTKEEK